MLKVEHILIVGHYGCGGVNAALTGLRVGLADNWIRHVGDVAQKHATLLAASELDTLRQARLCELNVVEQVAHVARTTIVQDAWQRAQPLTLHGLVYGLHNGLLNDLSVEASSPAMLEANYAASLSKLAAAGR